MLNKPSSLLAIAKRFPAQIVGVTGFSEILHAENDGAFGPGFAEIWRNAQRRGSEYLGSFFHGTRPFSSIGWRQKCRAR